MRFKRKVSFKDKPLIAKVVYIMAFVSLIPATYFAWQLFEEKKLTHHIDRFIADNFNNEDRAVIKKFVSLEKEPKEVNVYVAGKVLSDSDKVILHKRLNEYGLKDLQFIIHSTPNLEDVRAEPEMLKQLIVKQQKKLDHQDSLMNALSVRLDSLEKKRTGNKSPKSPS